MNARSLLIKPLAISIIALGLGYSSVSLALTDPSVSVGVAEPAPVIGAAEPAPADYVMYDISRQGIPAPQIEIGARVLLTAGTPTMMAPEQINTLIDRKAAEISFGKNALLDEKAGRLLDSYKGQITAMPDTDLGAVRMLAAYAPNLDVTLADDKEQHTGQIAAINDGFTAAGLSVLATRNLTLRGSADAMLTATQAMAENKFLFGGANFFVSGTIPPHDIEGFARDSLGLAKNQVGYNIANIDPSFAERFAAAVPTASRLPDGLAFMGENSAIAATIGKAFIMDNPKGMLTGSTGFINALDVGKSTMYSRAGLQITGMTAEDAKTVSLWVGNGNINSVTGTFASNQDASNALRVVDSSDLAYHFSPQQGITMARSVADMPKLAADQIQGMQAQAVEAPAGVPLNSSLETARVLKATIYRPADLDDLSKVPNVSMARGEDRVFYTAQQPQTVDSRGIDTMKEDEGAQ